MPIPVLRVQREVLIWEYKSSSGHSPLTEKGKLLNWTKMRGIDVLFSLHSVSNCASTPRVPRSAGRLLNCVRVGTSCTGHYYVLSGVGTLTTSVHFNSIDCSFNFSHRAWLTGFLLWCERSAEIPEYFSTVKSVISALSYYHEAWWVMYFEQLWRSRKTWEIFSYKLRAVLFNFMFEVIVKL